jgi:uncharacterized protein YjbI with pentapeptide repeats
LSNKSVGKQSSLDFSAKDLTSADMSGRELRNADFSNAILHDAQFQRSSLGGASFRCADLQGAKFCDTGGDQSMPSEAVGLSSVAFAGANLKGAQIPKQMLEFPQLHNVEEVSKSATTVMFTMIAACVFCVLTSATFPDAALLTGTSWTGAIPGLGLTLPVLPFLAASPFLLLALQFYFLLLLQRYEELLADLPAVFPDGIEMPKRIYPWLFSSLVPPRGDFRYRRRRVGDLFELIFAVILAYVVVPGSIWIMWFRALCTHRFAAYAALIALGCSVALSFAQFATSRVFLKSGMDGAKRVSSFYPWWMWVITAVAFCMFSIGTAITIQASIGSVVTDAGYSFYGVNEVRVPFFRQLLYGIGYFQVAQIADEDVSKKPPSWTGRETEGEPELRAITGANLDFKNLRYLRGYKSFLVNARLEHVDLKGAVLAFADLRGANLKGSQALGIDLTGARVSSIDTPSDLSFSNFENANFSRASLQGAKLISTGLRGAKFNGADLSAANLSGSDVDFNQLKEAEMLDDRTILSPPLKLSRCIRKRASIQVMLLGGQETPPRVWEVVKPYAMHDTYDEKKWKERTRAIGPCSTG